MYDSDVFREAKSAIEACHGLRQFFTILPPNTELSIILDSRIPCTLDCQSQNLTLHPRPASGADIEIVLFAESIRRLSSDSPHELLSFLSFFSSQVALGFAEFRLLSSVSKLKEKGYYSALKGLGPEIQGELTRLGFSALGTLSQVRDILKAYFKR